MDEAKTGDFGRVCDMEASASCKDKEGNQMVLGNSHEKAWDERSIFRLDLSSTSTHYIGVYFLDSKAYFVLRY